MRAEHARGPLFLSPPLPCNGPKGEGDKGGKGSLVGLGWCPLPLSSHCGWGRRLASTSDTNPLTLPEHPCYSPHRSNTNLTISRRNQKPREAHPTHPRTQRLKPIPTAHRAGPRLKQTTPSPHPTGSRAPSLTPRRWKDALDRAIADRPSPPRPRLGGRLAASLRYIKLGVADRLSPAETPSRRLARLRAYAISSKGPLGRLDPRVAHVTKDF